MDAALYDPSGGYYTTRSERWGRRGDYRTSPQTSPLFARTFAQYFESLYESMGRPPNVLLIEWGGGNGEFAKQFRETLAARFPATFEALEYVYVEQGADSRDVARNKQGSLTNKIVFTENLDSIDPGTLPCVVFSNELIDSFPVHRVQFNNGQLEELFVTADDDGVFQWLALPPSTAELALFFERLHIVLQEGQIVEVNLEAKRWLDRIAASISNGYIITVDYGSDASNLYDFGSRPAGSLRAFRKHSLVEDLLDAPGEQDLTSTVCWTDLVAAGRSLGMKDERRERLDLFLLRNGILAELEELMNRNDEAEAAQMVISAREMILPGGMASAFEVLTQVIGFNG
jgi:SAM-dependent MidA family methyltransferase